jgi:tRNA/tmRNA/rRNA uracil-C5-methylase (TrmA/RlmC/RlmD family)
VECAGPGDHAPPLCFDGPGLESQAAVGGFFQANPEANAGLKARLLALAGRGPGRAVDYFCGAGNLSLPLAQAGYEVRGLELDPAAVRLAESRAAELGLAARFERADLEAGPPPPGAAELVVLDPTRRGARRLARVLARGPAPRILHVGCDPATMARDGALLARGGYRLESLDVFDFFPGTHHLEALGSWRRV